MKQNLNISTPLDALDGEYSIFKALFISLQFTWRLDDGLVILKTFGFAAWFTKTILWTKFHTKKTKPSILLKISKWLFSLPKLG